MSEEIQNENNQEVESKSGSKFLVGAAIGAAVGVGVALLLAPKSGAETREELSNQYQKVNAKTHELTEAANQKTQELAKNIKNQTNQFVDKTKFKTEELVNKTKATADELLDKTRATKNKYINAGTSALDTAQDKLKTN